MSDDLVLELKKLIIETLKLEEFTMEDIEDDGQLFGMAWVWIPSTPWSWS